MYLMLPDNLIYYEFDITNNLGLGSKIIKKSNADTNPVLPPLFISN